MKRISPIPRIWSDIYFQLKKIARKDISIPEPPKPLVLGCWWGSSDEEKSSRWNATLHWIETYGGRELIERLTDEHFHMVSKFGSYTREVWSFEQIHPAEKYPKENISGLLQHLVNNWDEISGELASRCMPVCFTGKKSRCLKIQIFGLEAPPWGTWGIGKGRYRDVEFTNKNEFTKFRSRINSYLLPHRVDHIKFFYRNISPSGQNN